MQQHARVNLCFLFSDALAPKFTRAPVGMALFSRIFHALHIGSV